jgi:hypothetical protein
MENTFFITLLVSLIAVVIVLYFFKKQNAHISQSINYQANVKTDRKINDFIFANNLQRNNYIVELLKIHDLTIITWFDDEKKQLKNLLDNSIFKANIFLYTEFSVVFSERYASILLFFCKR